MANFAFKPPTEPGTPKRGEKDYGAGMTPAEVVWDTKASRPNYGYRKIHALVNSIPESDKISTRQVRKHLGVGHPKYKGQYTGDDGE